MNNKSIAGLLLAGGRSSRMGQNKSFIKFFGKSMLEIVLERACLQVENIAINSNERIDDFFSKKYELLEDCIQGRLGPLVGILTGLKWATSLKKKIKFLVIFPVDSPFIPTNFVKTLDSNASDFEIIMSRYQTRIHPVCSMWNVSLMNQLEEDIRHGTRKIEDFSRKCKTKVVNFKQIGYDPFFNVNREEDYLLAKQIFEQNFLKKS